jgi:hypothetical protein
MVFGKQAKKNAHDAGLNKLHTANMRGRLALVRGEVELGRLGRITLTVVP